MIGKSTRAKCYIYSIKLDLCKACCKLEKFNNSSATLLHRLTDFLYYHVRWPVCESVRHISCHSCSWKHFVCSRLPRFNIEARDGSVQHSWFHVDLAKLIKSVNRWSEGGNNVPNCCRFRVYDDEAFCDSWVYDIGHTLHMKLRYVIWILRHVDKSLIKRSYNSANFSCVVRRDSLNVIFELLFVDNSI